LKKSLKLRCSLPINELLKRSLSKTVTSRPEAKRLGEILVKGISNVVFHSGAILFLMTCVCCIEPPHDSTANVSTEEPLVYIIASHSCVRIGSLKIIWKTLGIVAEMGWGVFRLLCEGCHCEKNSLPFLWEEGHEHQQQLSSIWHSKHTRLEYQDRLQWPWVLFPSFESLVGMSDVGSCWQSSKAELEIA